jgi:hypothetical protein
MAEPVGMDLLFLSPRKVARQAKHAPQESVKERWSVLATMQKI